MHHLRSLSPDDLPQVVAVYRDAVITQAAAFYAPQQIRAWSEHAACDRGVREALERGYGLASCSVRSPGIIEAFALLDPLDRLALLYCRCAPKPASSPNPCCCATAGRWRRRKPCPMRGNCSPAGG